MKDWVYSANRQKHQRNLNRVIRKLNKNIANDNVWRGRFYVHQLRADWMKYDDNSGGDLRVLLQFVDKKTGTTYEMWNTANSWAFIGGHTLWETMNWFIVKYCDVWRKEDPYSDTTDYTKMR